MIFCHSQIEAVGDLTQSLPLPLKGEGLDIARLGFAGFALLVHSWITLAQQGRSGASLVSVSPKPHTGPHRAEFGFHRFFLVRFWLGRAAKPSDRMHSCIRFSIPVLGSPILCLLLRKF